MKFAAVGTGATLAVTLLAACADPTESAFPVTLKNDTQGSVTLKQCDATCNQFHEVDHLAPGSTVQVNTASDGVENWWQVTDAEGNIIGCLPLVFHHKTDGVVVGVSTATTCPS